MARFFRYLTAALFVALVACRPPVPGLGPPGQGEPPGRAPDGSSAPGQGAAPGAVPPGPIDPDAPPRIDALEPDNGAPGTEIRIRGNGLTGRGRAVYFGTLVASASVESAGALLAVVPEGARTGDVSVVGGEDRSSMRFRVTKRLVLSILKTLPAAVGLPVPVSVDAYDTSDEAIPNPAYSLSIDPPHAARVLSIREILPLEPVPFRVQARIGSVSMTKDVVACRGKLWLEHFVGTGNPYQVVDGKGQLTEDATPDFDTGPAARARLLRPWGIVSITLKDGRRGILIADGGSGRIRFVPSDGASIETVVGGGTRPLLAGETDSDPTKVALNEPTGLAVGEDIDDDDNKATRDVVLIAERHRILAWYHKKPSPNLRVIAGIGPPTFTRQTATDSQLVMSQALGDQDLPRKVCGEATAASFWDPAGLAIVTRDAKINKKTGPEVMKVAEVFIADANNHVIRRIVRKARKEISDEYADAKCTVDGLPAKSGVITTVLGSGKPGFPIVTGDATGTQLDAPFDVALDPLAGNSWLYVADTNNSRILRVEGLMNVPNESGTKSLSFGKTTSYPSDVYAPTPWDKDDPYYGALDHPSGILLLPGSNDLFIADTLLNRVVLRPSGDDARLTAIGSCSLEANPAAGLAWPLDLALDAIQGTGADAAVTLFVSDFRSNEVRKMSNFEKN